MSDYTQFEFSRLCLNEEEQEQYDKLLQTKAAKKAAITVSWFERASRLREEEKRIADELYRLYMLRTSAD